jgi:hypothetical protein
MWTAAVASAPVTAAPAMFRALARKPRVSKRYPTCGDNCIGNKSTGSGAHSADTEPKRVAVGAGLDVDRCRRLGANGGSSGNAQSSCSGAEGVWHGADLEHSGGLGADDSGTCDMQSSTWNETRVGRVGEYSRCGGIHAVDSADDRCAEVLHRTIEGIVPVWTVAVASAPMTAVPVLCRGLT